ncbi:MAG: PocR ligand-binding domain-containing protein [Bacteroidetes bacterium]|nr:PocR ligand-binding domain-containing protein [Bacteroidota bacterium]
MGNQPSIILKPELLKILDNFSSVFSVRIAYFLPDGSEYKVGHNAGISPCCRMMRDVLGYHDKCLALDHAVLNAAKKTKTLQTYRCHGGCTEAVKPLFEGETLTGFIMIGQFTSEKKIPLSVLQDSEKLGVREKVICAFTQIPRFDSDKTNSIISLFSSLTDLINLKHMIQKRESSCVQNVIEYMNESNLRISLAQAAGIAGKSESRLRHKFKEDTGISFSAMREQICMKKAKHLLVEHPEKPIKEAAYQLGFPDPLYFSRAFRKYFGYSPTAYREKITAETTE